MYPSMFIMSYMNDYKKKNTLIDDLKKENTLIDDLKKENERLLLENKNLNDRLHWVILSKDEIYKKYINLIIKKNNVY